MAFDAFVKIDEIEGESRDQGHSGWIEVIRFAFALRQKISGSPSSAGGASAGRADFRDFIFKKELDHASPQLVFRNKEYEIKMSECYDENRDKKRPFHSAKEVSWFFDRIAEEDIIAFHTIIETAELSYHHLCYAPRRCSPQPNIQQALDELSLKRQ